MAPPSRAPRRTTVAAGFVTGMLSGLRARRIDPERVLRAQGIDPRILRERDARLPIEDYAALYNGVVRELDDEGFGLFPAPLRCGTFEFLCRGLIGSGSLGEALERAARYLRIVLPDLAIRVGREGDGAILEIAERRRLRARRDDPSRVFAFEWLLRLLHGLSCWLVARGIALERVQFPYSRPPHAADYALVYTEHSEFGAPTLVATFSASLLDLPVRREQADVAAFLEGAPGKISMLYRRDREIVRSVRDRLARALPESPSLDEVARDLHLSARTLHRRLNEEGSSFRALKDALRREAALSRLANSPASIARIAAELGYSEPSAFFRAFQQWTGEAPSAYRKRLKPP